MAISKHSQKVLEDRIRKINELLGPINSAIQNYTGQRDPAIKELAEFTNQKNNLEREIAALQEDMKQKDQK